FLALLTCRPEFPPPWGLRTHLTPLALQRLPQSQVEVMIARVTGGKALPPEVLQHVVTKTDGVPLFVEELTKTVLESGLLRETADSYALPGPLPPLAIPATLHDSLMARLDRLATVKAVAQLGAVLGRTFSYELLQAVTPLDETLLQDALARLVDTELLYQREEGMAQVLQGIAAWRATGAVHLVPYFSTLLADVCGHRGHTAEGLQALAEAYTLLVLDNTA